MILFTRRGSVLGDTKFGANTEDLIYSLNASSGTITTVITEQINNYCPSAKRFPFRVAIKFHKGTERDIAIVDVIINSKRATGLVLT